MNNPYIKRLLSALFPRKGIQPGFSRSIILIGSPGAVLLNFYNPVAPVGRTPAPSKMPVEKIRFPSFGFNGILIMIMAVENGFEIFSPAEQFS